MEMQEFGQHLWLSMLEVSLAINPIYLVADILNYN